MVLCVVILNLWLTAGVRVVVPIDSFDDTRLIAGVRAVMTGICFVVPIVVTIDRLRFFLLW